MRCRACDTLLSDFEATRRGAESNEFIDLCNTCYNYVTDDWQVVERPDLMNVEDELDNLQ